MHASHSGERDGLEQVRPREPGQGFSQSRTCSNQLFAVEGKNVDTSRPGCTTGAHANISPTSAEKTWLDKLDKMKSKIQGAGTVQAEIEGRNGTRMKEIWSFT